MCELYIFFLESSHIFSYVKDKILKACSHYEYIVYWMEVHIVWVHTECVSTAVHIELTFSQSTSIGGLSDKKKCSLVA